MNQYFSHRYSFILRILLSVIFVGVRNSIQGSTSGSFTTIVDNINSSYMSPKQPPADCTTGEEKLHDKEPTAKSQFRICLMVEPSPITYVSGYANRFQQLLHYIKDHTSDHIELITTEVVVPDPPTTFLDTITIHNCNGFRFPFYPTMSVVSPMSSFIIGSILRHQVRPNLIHVSSPGLMVFHAILWSRLLNVPLIMSYHTHLPMYISSYIPYPILGPVVKWIGT
jgi:hypothetical protein